MLTIAVPVVVAWLHDAGSGDEDEDSRLQSPVKAAAAADLNTAHCSESDALTPKREPKGLALLR